MKTELTLGKDQKSIDYKAEIIDVNFNPIHDFTPHNIGVLIPTYEYVKVKFDLIISIEESTWTLPYMVLLRKGLNEFELNKFNFPKRNVVKDNEETLINPVTMDEVYDFFKIRSINIPLYNIEDKNHFRFLMHFLFLLDLNKIEKTDFLQYYSIKPQIFYHKNDFKLNTNYCIIRYKNILNNEKWYLEHSDNWLIPFVNLKELRFEDEILNNHLFFQIKDTHLIEGSIIYNIVPEHYTCSYAKDFQNLQNTKLFEAKDSEVVFKGSYNDCKEIISNQEKYKKFINVLIIQDLEKEKKRNIANSHDYFRNGEWKRDTFDAMTDGQLGNYDDYNGNFDDLDTWSKG